MEDKPRWIDEGEEEADYRSRRTLSGLADCLQPKTRWQREQLARHGRIPQITYTDYSQED